MRDSNVLIISDAGSQSYWSALAGEIEKEIGPARIVLDRDISALRNHRRYHVILVDVADFEELHELIPEMHQVQPESHIFIVSSTPTWKETREIFRLGARMIRKSSEPDEIIEALRPL